MPSPWPGRVAAGRILLLALTVIAPGEGSAQGRPVRFDADSAANAAAAEATSQGHLDRDEVDGLPVDSVEGALLLLPGVTAGAGAPSFRGAPSGEYATYLNGVDVSPGSRRVRLGFGTNALAAATAVTGPLPGMLGNSRSGALLLRTPSPAFGRFTRASYESDRLIGASLGFNRLEASMGGASRSARVFVAGTLTGQKAAEFGAGARESPVFTAAGLDTTVAVPTSPGSSGSDTTYVGLAALAVGRGDCDRFAGSASDAIASNYGIACGGDRTPASAASGYRFLATADYDAGRASKLTVLVSRGRESTRRFSYPDLFNRANLFAQQQETRVYGLTLSGPFGARRSGGAYHAGISRQSDQLVVGPLTPESERRSFDPAGGLMLGGLDFRWDLESFPVDSTLIANYRADAPGTRRSPYSLENTSQYTLVDQFADGPYATHGFPERGGPVGRLTLFREERSVAFANATWAVSANALFTLGGEHVRYDLTNYDHALTSQALSDVYLALPSRGALFAEDRLAYGPVTFIGGVRYDFFASNAERPYALDTMAILPGSGANPSFGTYLPFPRITSYTDADGLFMLDGRNVPLVTFREDARHASWSPRFRATVDVSEGTRLRAGLARHARMPDLGLVFAGVNTDLAITNTGQVYGTDLGFERSWASELGVHQKLGAATALDVAGFHRTGDDLVVAGVRAAPDPTRANTNVSLLEWTNAGRESAFGAELALSLRAGPLRALAGYTIQRVRAGDAIRAAGERPHTVVATLEYTAPRERRSGLFRGAALWLAFRATSGAPYTPCDATASTLSDEPCLFGSAGIVPNSARLPGFRQLDVRFARRLGSETSPAALYVDARNVLSTKNTIRVFSGTGTADNPAARAARVDGVLADYADEAGANGTLQPDGGVDLTFAGRGAAGCAGWVTANGAGGEPTCIALVRAEQRFGDGDGIFTPAEQRETANASFDALLARGFRAEPRRIRVGVTIGF